MSTRFYIPGELIAGPLEIAGTEAHHLAHVCRLAEDDAITLFNGDGREYPARITDIGRRRVMVEVGAGVKVDREPDVALTIAAPLPKGDRGQFLVEKLTELGAAAFVPLTTRRSVVKADENKREKLQRYVIEASKQCGRNILMDIQPVREWADFCRHGKLPELRLLAHPGDARSSTARLPTVLREERGGTLERSLIAAVGPEGGFTDEEVQLAVEADWQLIELGPRILRVETAAIALAAQIVLS